MMPLTPLLHAFGVVPDACGNYADRPAHPLSGVGAEGRALLSKSETGGTFSLVMATLPSGAALLPPVTSNETTLYYVLEGTPVIYLGGVLQASRGADDGKPAKGILAAPGVTCEINNDTGQPVRLLILTLRARPDHRAPVAGLCRASTMESDVFVDPTDFPSCLDDIAPMPTHETEAEDETFYVVSGQYVIEAEGVHIEVGPGRVVSGARGHTHTYQCATVEGGKVEIIVTPGGQHNFARTVVERDGAREGDLPVFPLPEDAANRSPLRLLPA